MPSGVLLADRTTTPDREYVILDGSWGVSVTPNGSSQFVYIDWASIFQAAIDMGLFTPTYGQPTATQGVYVAVETYKNAVADLYHTNFRVSSKQ